MSCHRHNPLLRVVVGIATLALMNTCWALSAAAQSPHEADNAQPYDGPAASWDAYRYHEFQRQEAIRYQVGLNDAMKYHAGAGPFGDTIYYRSRPTLDFQYGSPAPWSFNVFPGVVAPGWGAVQPWPLMPAGVWQSPYVRTVPQPIGQRQVQTGPNQWESHSVYAEPWLNDDRELPNSPSAVERPVVRSTADPQPPPPLPPIRRSTRREF